MKQNIIILSLILAFALVWFIFSQKENKQSDSNSFLDYLIGGGTIDGKTPIAKDGYLLAKDVNTGAKITAAELYASSGVISAGGVAFQKIGADGRRLGTWYKFPDGSESPSNYNVLFEDYRKQISGQAPKTNTYTTGITGGIQKATTGVESFVDRLFGVKY